MSDHTQPGPSPDEPARPEFNPPLPDDPDERARRLVESVGGAVLRLDNRARQQEEGRRRRARADLDEKRRTVPPPPRGGDRAGPPLVVPEFYSEASNAAKVLPPVRFIVGTDGSGV